MMDSDGSDERRVVSLTVSPSQPPVWSPDGTQLAFLVYQSENTESGYDKRYIVHTVRPDGSGLTELGDAASSPAWSPDGTRIAFIRDGDETHGLYAMDPDGGNERLLWSLDREDDALWFWYNNLAWSPDGSEILYGSASGRFSGPRRVVVVRVDGSGARTLTEPRSSRNVIGGAEWSPDGARIAFHVASDASDVVLYTTARDGSDIRVVVRGNYERLVAEHSDWRDVSGDIAACSGGYVVPKPKKNTGLVQDCETLLRVRDQLAGDAVLNWTADEKISKWRGVGTEGSPPRIVRLIPAELVSLSQNRPIPPKLTGCVPAVSSRRRWATSTDLEAAGPLVAPLSLHSNQLSGSIPPELGNLANLRDLRRRSSPFMELPRGNYTGGARQSHALGDDGLRSVVGSE